MALTPAQKKKADAEAPAKEEAKDEAAPAQAPAKDESKDDAPAPESKGKDEAAPVQKEDEAPAKSKTMKVQNPHRRFHYTHPQSGVRIGAGEVKELVRDSWLEMQCEAGVLKEV